jgi:hypothetical protein
LNIGRVEEYCATLYALVSQLASDRTSRSPLGNQVRLVLHTAAYWLMLTVPDAISSPHHSQRSRYSRSPDAFTETATRVRTA